MIVLVLAIVVLMYTVISFLYFQSVQGQSPHVTSNLLENKNSDKDSYSKIPAGSGGIFRILADYLIELE